MAAEGPAQKAAKAPAPAVASKFTKAPANTPGSPATDVLLTIEVVPIQAQKKMKIGLESTVRQFIDSIVKNYPSVERPEALYLYYKSSGIWMEEQRKVGTYLPKNDDILELKYKGNSDVIQLTTLDVYYPRTRATEIIKFYPQTTVFGIIQALEQKKMSLVDSIKLSLNGTVLENRDALLSSYGITERASLEYSDSASSADEGPRAPPPSKPKSQSFIAELRTVQSSDNIKRSGVPIMPVRKDSSSGTEPEQNNELLNALKNRRTKVEVGKTQSESSLPTKTAVRPTSKSFMASPIAPASTRGSLPNPVKTSSQEPAKPVEPKPEEPKHVQQPAHSSTHVPDELELDTEFDDVTKLLEQQLKELEDEAALDEVLTAVEDGVQQLQRRNTVKGSSAVPVAPPPPEDDVTKFTREWKEFDSQCHPNQASFDKVRAIKTLAVLLQKTEESTQIQNHLQGYSADDLIAMLQKSLTVVSSFG